MKKVTALVASLLVTLGCLAQSGSPYSNNVFPAQSFTATAQTGAVIQLNGQQLSYGAGTLTVTGSSLTTVTFAVQGSSDGGATFYALPITPVTAGASPAATATATAAGLYQFSLVGITHIKIVTSGTFTATSVSFVLTATPNVTISHGGSSAACGSNNIPCTNTSNTYSAVQVFGSDGTEWTGNHSWIVRADASLGGWQLFDTQGTSNFAIYSYNSSAGTIGALLNSISCYSWTGSSLSVVGVFSDTSMCRPSAGVIDFGNGNTNGSDTSAWVRMGAIGSGVSGNTDLVGRLTLSGGTATYTFVKTYATRPACFADDEAATPTLATCVSTTTGLTIHGTGTDVVAYHVVSFN